MMFRPLRRFRSRSSAGVEIRNEPHDAVARSTRTCWQDSDGIHQVHILRQPHQCAPFASLASCSCRITATRQRAAEPRPAAAVPARSTGTSVRSVWERRTGTRRGARAQCESSQPVPRWRRHRAREGDASRSHLHVMEPRRRLQRPRLPKSTRRISTFGSRRSTKTACG